MGARCQRITGVNAIRGYFINSEPLRSHLFYYDMKIVRGLKRKRIRYGSHLESRFARLGYEVLFDTRNVPRVGSHNDLIVAVYHIKTKLTGHTIAFVFESVFDFIHISAFSDAVVVCYRGTIDILDDYLGFGFNLFNTEPRIQTLDRVKRLQCAVIRDG